MTDHASSAPSTVTLTRTLRGAQAERRTRVLDANAAELRLASATVQAANPPDPAAAR